MSLGDSVLLGSLLTPMSETPWPSSDSSTGDVQTGVVSLLGLLRPRSSWVALCL